MKKYVIYVLWGIFFVLPGEFFLQILIHNAGFNVLISTFISYVVFLTIVVLFSRFFKKIFKGDAGFILSQYIIWGVLGLVLIEWVLIGNSPSGNPDANQLGMFTWWGMTSIFPLIATKVKGMYPMRRRTIQLWSILAIFTIFPAILFGDAGRYIGLVIFSYGTIIYNYFVYRYIKDLRRNSSV